MENRNLINEVVQDDVKLHCIVKSLFDQFDSKGNEKLSGDELFSLLKHVCQESSWKPPLMGEVRDIVKEFDGDRDGFITYTEFKSLIKRILMSSIDA